jgi:hypothetical protein
MRALSLSKDERKIIYGKLNYVDWIMIRIAYNPKFEITRYTHLLIKCAEFGYLDIIKRVNPDVTHMHLICEEAIKHGKIDILKWYKRFDDYIISLIVKYNQLEILEYLWDYDNYHEYLIQHYASKFNNLNMLQWSLITKKHKFNGSNIIRIMICFRHVEMLRWIAEYDPSLIPQIGPNL